MTQPSPKVSNEGIPRKTNSGDVADPNETVKRIAGGVIHQESPDAFSTSAAFSSGPHRRFPRNSWRSKCETGAALKNLLRPLKPTLSSCATGESKLGQDFPELPKHK